MHQDKFGPIETFAKEHMAKLGLHAWPHVQRVLKLCTVISKSEGTITAVDLDSLKIAALLHDVAKYLEKENESTDHGDVGASMTETFLRSLDFGEEKIKLICHSIRVHTHRDEPITIEAKILHDADFLDKLGAVGIATIFIKACLTDTTIEEVSEAFEADSQERSYVGLHIRWLKKPHLFTKTALKIAAKRNRMVSAFFSQLKDELEANSFSVGIDL